MGRHFKLVHIQDQQWHPGRNQQFGPGRKSQSQWVSYKRIPDHHDLSYHRQTTLQLALMSFWSYPLVDSEEPVYRSVIITGSSFFPWMWLSTRPKNARTPICARLISGPAAGKGDRKPLKKKTDMLTQDGQNDYNSGIDAACVLFDSWFSYDSIINKVVTTGYNVVCRLKNGNIKYQYQGKDYTLKELWKQIAIKQQRLIAGYPIKGCCLIVTLPETGEVNIVVHIGWP